ncbi:hypothetical protein [Polaribacter glomeratus]|uniref:Right handed beta helix domain-containing protein n=1 Tax=Polaribacter glomeratus TaxID=102 RepID=A0A2S7WY64_9FLAO|nr:hypothetical protein [Polaribacter glomeratus]PQJ82520.1 hypothetical protein BTO16_08005 [Polaribacter glomeratus]TXD65026.1 hypothetical protein ESX12_12865 [Polaribacter glomeratus]
MRYFITFLVCVALISMSSCRKDFSTIPNFGSLEFSKDTVFLDTVFTNIGSATYNLKVYNRGNKSITIPKIALENGAFSNYRLNVDGISGKEFNDIDILAKDSIFVFIETTIDASTAVNPLYTDRILFDNGTNQQGVDLVTLVQDANFIFPGKDPITMKIDSLTINGQATSIKGRFLTDAELTFTNTKPTVIYGYAAVSANKTLTIEAGARVHFHNNSGLIIDKKATLKVNGTLAEKVIFEGDRLESGFSKIPGQWGTIWMRAGSKDNEINHAQIKNGIIGILIDSIGATSAPTLKLQNSEIYNHSNFGILARETNIEAHNVVIGSAGEASLAATIGGTYNFTHSTFANFWNNGIRQLPAVLINNFFTYVDNGQEIIETRDLHAATFTNCIFDGNNNIEFLIDKVEGGGIFNYKISNCMIQFNDSSNSFEGNSELDFTNPFYQNIILNGNSNFRNSRNQDFIIGQDSDAINKAKTSIFNLDILGVDRTTNPDIGAYQHIIFE